MKKVIAITILAFLFGNLSICPAQARVKVTKSVEVNADLKSTWLALEQYQREEKRFHKQVVSDKNGKIVLKEEFLRVPVVGNAYINYVEENHPFKRIDYKLKGSKVLTVFEGAWKLEKVKNKNAVSLTLITDIDSWVPVPFKNSILKKTTAKGMMKRLAFVKNQAEKITKTNLQKESAQAKSLKKSRARG